MDKKISFLKRWSIFIKERFPLGEHLLLILFFFLANAFIAALTMEQVIWPLTRNHILSFFVILYVFFHMRIFDEIKDYQTDLKVHPERPLARSLISLNEAKFVAFFMIFLEIFISFFISLEALLSCVFVCVYTLIMYKEFFISQWLRPRLATYAMMHTIVSSWMSLYIFSSVCNLHFWQVPIEYWIFAFSNWMIFNIFEFGRKTFGKEEEKELVESYSKRLGIFRAALNVVFMAFVAYLIAIWFGVKFKIGFLYFVLLHSLFVLTMVSSLFYVKYNNLKWAKFFRIVCSIFILFYNVTIVIGGFLKK